MSAIAARRRGFSAGKSRRANRQARPFGPGRFALESLEPRQMLAAAPLSSNDLLFHVVDDATANVDFRYGVAGAAQGSANLAAANSAPRGVATIVALNRTFVVDANRNVYVYGAGSNLLGSWAAGTMANNATPEGIATDGTDVWIVDSKSDKVFRYAGAATRLSGSQNAASSFTTWGSNTSPKDIVTDGNSLWIVDDGQKVDRVFRYTMTGGNSGVWDIDAANKAPMGIALDPLNANDMWIADSGTDRVYRYDGATIRYTGSQSAAASFALGAANKNPQGLALAHSALAASPFEIEWIRQFGSAGDDIGRSADVDDAGRVYVSGHTSGSLAAPNPGGVSTSYLAQFGDAGDLHWIDQSDPAAGGQQGVRVAADSLGNVFQVIGPNSISTIASLRNYDPSGALQWTATLPAGQDIFSVAVDDLGDAYMESYAGNFIFLRKLDGATGDIVWTRSLDTGGTTNSSTVSFDGLGNIYVVAYTYGSAVGPSAGLADGVLAKYDTAGNLQWAKQFGTPGYDLAFGVTADALGNVYVSGQNFASVDAYYAGQQDVFIAKFDVAGSVQWTRQLGTTGVESGVGMQTDGNGNVYFMGATSAPLGGPRLGGVDILLGQYSSAGDLLWLQQLGTAGDEGGSGLAGDSLGNLYVGTRTSSSWGAPNAGGLDAVLVKLTPPPAAASASLAAAAAPAMRSSAQIADAVFAAGDFSRLFAGNHDAVVRKYRPPRRR